MPPATKEEKLIDGLRKSPPFYPHSVAKCIVERGGQLPLLLGVRNCAERYRFLGTGTHPQLEVICQSYGQVRSDYDSWKEALYAWERARSGIQTAVCEVRFDQAIHACVDGMPCFGQTVWTIESDPTARNDANALCWRVTMDPSKVVISEKTPHLAGEPAPLTPNTTTLEAGFDAVIAYAVKRIIECGFPVSVEVHSEEKSAVIVCDGDGFLVKMAGEKRPCITVTTSKGDKSKIRETYARHAFESVVSCVVSAVNAKGNAFMTQKRDDAKKNLDAIREAVAAEHGPNALFTFNEVTDGNGVEYLYSADYHASITGETSVQQAKEIVGLVIEADKKITAIRLRTRDAIKGVCP